MARIRTIKPEFFTSESIGDLSLHARLTFIGLWTYVDDRGRARNNPRAIRGALWPNDEDTVSSTDVARFIEELVAHDMVCLYTADGANHLHVINLNEHQTINRASASKLPPCPIHDLSTPLTEDSLSPHGGVTECSVSAHGALTSGREGKGREEEREVEPASATPTRGKPRSRATPPPEHFEITEDLLVWAQAKHLPADILRPQTERFLDHHRSKGNEFKDWKAAWRTWMSRTAEYAAADSRASPASPPGGSFTNAPEPLAFAEPL